VRKINADNSCIGVIVPHYYLFPESLRIKKTLALYLPDYTPHFFENSSEFSNIQNKEVKIGKEICRKASVIFTNSHFSKSYLPHTKLKVEDKKIQVFYLPNLNKTEGA
jgi:hypothetical protein